jgi:hypothetical protein
VPRGEGGVSKDLGYRAPVIAGNILESDLPLQPGEWQLRNVFDRGETHQEMYYGCPLRPGFLCAVPILPKRNPNGSGWTWDGNTTAPTLAPSINCVAPVGCGWHGFITGGVVR